MSRDCQITYAAIGIKGIGKGCRLAAETHIALDAGEPLGRKLTLRLENEGLSVWTAYSRHSENGMAWFSFHEGNVVVKNPDPEILQKMRLLAQALSAKVQGDDGEFYDGRAGGRVGC